MPIRLTQVDSLGSDPALAQVGLQAHSRVSPTHLQSYLNKFVFRFNRLFWTMVTFDSVLKIAVLVEVRTYMNFYVGAWHMGTGSVE